MLKRLIILYLVTLFIFILAIMPLPWNENIQDVFTDQLLSLRGSRPISDDIVYVYLDSQDIESLGGWPITRDYYSYFLHICRESGARTVGIDVLLNTENRRYPEHDNDLQTFFYATKHDVLPSAFESISDSAHAFVGQTLLTPLEKFSQHVSAIGFANLGDQNIIRRAPLFVHYADSLYPSFGLQLAAVFLHEKNYTFTIEKNNIIIQDSLKQTVIPAQQQQLALNYFGDVAALQSISFVHLIKNFQQDSTSHLLQDKLVLLGITAPGISPIKTTPLHPAFPASLIQLTVADNILQKNALSYPFAWLFIIFLWPLLAFLLLQKFNIERISIYFACVIFYLITANFMIRAAIVLPIFYPTLSALTSLTILLVSGFKTRHVKELAKRRRLVISIKTKRNELAHLKKELLTAQDSQSASQEQISHLQKQIYALEGELQDSTIQHATVQPARAFPHIIYAENSPMNHVLAMVDKVADEDITVFIKGSTGSGKEIIAQTIHQLGKRVKAHFIAVNCGALPETLLESELFGHEKGAFTGATATRKGRFELADKGTLFLDEITETSAAFQSKLLRVLQEGTFERLGSEKTLTVDVRVIAASSRDIQKAVDSGSFRPDLFYRLNGFPIEIPSLAEREMDIPLLAEFFIRKHGYDGIRGFSKKAFERLQDYHWPGNVRELENSVRRAAILAQSEKRNIIRENDLPLEIQSQSVNQDFQSLDAQILKMLRSLQFSHSAISQTARAFEKDRSTITDNFRGICFEYIVKNDFDMQRATEAIAESKDKEIVDRVKKKIAAYMPPEDVSDQKQQSLFKGLPKKYHVYLKAIIEH